MDSISDWFKLAISVVAGIFGAWIASIVGVFRISNAVHAELSGIKVTFANIETKFAEIDTAFARADGEMEKALSDTRHRVLTAVQTQFAGPLSEEVRREHAELRNDIRALANSLGQLREQVAVLIDRDQRQQERLGPIQPKR